MIKRPVLYRVDTGGCLHPEGTPEFRLCDKVLDVYLADSSEMKALMHLIDESEKVAEELERQRLDLKRPRHLANRRRQS